MRLRRGVLRLRLLLLAMVALLAVGVAAQDRPKQTKPAAKGSSTAPAVAAPAARSNVLQSGVTVGPGQKFGNLTVLPVFSLVQRDTGELISLDQALRARKAEVRERGDGAEVNELIIENKGKANILVLAGTVIQGGNQDRQVGQDFIIGAKKTVPIDAYCVEHGRWQADREGQATGGKFSVVNGIAPTTVRVAGQYKQNQTQVWDAVAKVNAANGVAPESGTLAGTLDNKRMVAKRRALAHKVTAFLDAREPQKNLVGLAWAVDGNIRAVRWFMNHKVFGMYETALAEAAALESLTAAKAQETTAKSVTPEAVVAFVRDIDRAARKLKTTMAGNVNEYRLAPKGASSRVRAQPAPAKPGAPPAPQETITHDYSAY